jgi:hypothetical protein
MLWFLRGLRRGVVTTRYPAELDAWARMLPSSPVFRSSLLTRELADRIVGACPNGSVTCDGDELVLDLGACTACGRCARAGGEAVAPSGAPLLAAREREALRKRVAIRGDRRAG